MTKHIKSPNMSLKHICRAKNMHNNTHVHSHIWKKKQTISIYLSIYLSIHPSIYLSIWHITWYHALQVAMIAHSSATHLTVPTSRHTSHWMVKPRLTAADPRGIPVAINPLSCNCTSFDLIAKLWLIKFCCNKINPQILAISAIAIQGENQATMCDTRRKTWENCQTQYKTVLRQVTTVKYHGP